jgi:hypothetical protein
MRVPPHSLEWHGRLAREITRRMRVPPHTLEWHGRLAREITRRMRVPLHTERRRRVALTLNGVEMYMTATHFIFKDLTALLRVKRIFLP